MPNRPREEPTTPPNADPTVRARAITVRDHVTVLVSRPVISRIHGPAHKLCIDVPVPKHSAAISKYL